MLIRLSIFYQRSSFETCTVLVKEITEFLEWCYACNIRASKYLRGDIRAVPLHDLCAADYPITRDYEMFKSHLLPRLTASFAVQHTHQAQALKGTRV